MRRLLSAVSVVALLAAASCHALSSSTGAVMANAAPSSMATAVHPVGDARHVVYTVHIVEFIESEPRQAGVGDFETPIVRERGVSHRSSSPWLISAVGSSADLRVVQEETVVVGPELGLHTTMTGLVVRFTPIQIEPVTGRVLSAIEVAGMDGGSRVETELWVGGDEPVLAAVLDQSSHGLEKGLIRESDHAYRKRYAVYVAARPVPWLSSGEAIGVGNSTGLGDLLLFAGPGYRSHTAALTVRLDSPPTAALTWRGWLSDAWRGTMVLPLSAHGSVELVAERLLFDDAMWLGFHMFGPRGHRAALGAISISEQVVVSRRLTVGAGYAPIVYSFHDGVLHDAFWWIDAAYGDRSALQLRYGHDSHETGRQPAVSLGWRWDLPW